MKYPEAGTLIAYDPISDNAKYMMNDQEFKKYCCEDMGGCDMFLMHRPINNGSDYKPPTTSEYWEYTYKSPMMYCSLIKFL